MERNERRCLIVIEAQIKFIQQFCGISLALKLCHDLMGYLERNASFREAILADCPTINVAFRSAIGGNTVVPCHDSDPLKPEWRRDGSRNYFTMLRRRPHRAKHLTRLGRK